MLNMMRMHTYVGYVVLVAALFAGCQGMSAAPDDGLVDDLAVVADDLSPPDLAADLSGSECGALYGVGPAYSCAFLTGACSTPGHTCLCWERGSMVCQANHHWELILDLNHCPDKPPASSFGGLGCLGAATMCADPGPTTCTCDPLAKVYQCASVDLATTD